MSNLRASIRDGFFILVFEPGEKISVRRKWVNVVFGSSMVLFFTIVTVFSLWFLFLMGVMIYFAAFIFLFIMDGFFKEMSVTEENLRKNISSVFSLPVWDGILGRLLYLEDKAMKQKQWKILEVQSNTFVIFFDGHILLGSYA